MPPREPRATKRARNGGAKPPGTPTGAPATQPTARGAAAAALHRDEATPLAPLWFGVAAGAVAWSLHLLVSYALVPVVCASGLELLFHVVTLVAAAVTVVAMVVAWRTWAGMGVRGQATIRGAAGRASFMALSGVLLSALFLLAIIAGGLPAFFLSPCGWE